MMDMDIIHLFSGLMLVALAGLYTVSKSMEIRYHIRKFEIEQAREQQRILEDNEGKNQELE